ncbi:MAG TPA: M28 family peptidase [Puia sp.]|nr:M28 family peptidase [Puia sp.]
MNRSHILLILFLTAGVSLATGNVFAQSNESVTSAIVNNILLGNYTPSTYQAATVITDPNVISQGLLGNISADSLTADLYALNGFRNRNTFSDTSSATAGIGASRRWVYNKFLQYSQAGGNRLQVGYLKFTYNPSSYPCTENPSIQTHYNVLAVLPGSQTTDKSLIIIEAHMDSRNNNNCDVSGSAPGVGDNATGTAIVLELARVMSRYTFRNTIVFSINTGEEQGLIGAHAFAQYLKAQKVLIKAVNNNDVSGGIFCGHTASAPGCPFYGNLDSIDLRIFSLGDVNSPNKQWARYVKLEYKEQLSGLVTIPTDLQIMENDDRIGRGGDHQAFTAVGYTAVRFTQANEDGDANSDSTGYTDRQHSLRDSLGHEVNGVIDSIYINTGYLARNTLVNGNSLAMVALGPDTVTLNASLWTANTVQVKFSPAGAPAYRVAIRSTTNDWDSVYTITGTSSAIITVPYGANKTFYISAAAVDANGTESQFSTEWTLSTGMVILDLTSDSAQPAPPPSPSYYGIQLMPNRPNPFDESTLITINSGTDLFANRTCLQFTGIDGHVISRIPVPLRKGVNQIVYNHGFAASGIYICTLLIDGQPVQSTEMVFGRR